MTADAHDDVIGNTRFPHISNPAMSQIVEPEVLYPGPETRMVKCGFDVHPIGFPL
jgi:hypothetical protein